MKRERPSGPANYYAKPADADADADAVTVPLTRERERRAVPLRAKATEAVKTLDHSRPATGLSV
ncbi:MAG: hypothetical protein LC749_01280 [Actinobacteria bacterium]|nr:hypothetical protein [Actinomycetota bacterium]